MLVAAFSGCQLWPFKDNDRSSIITPDMRAASIREMGSRADDATTAEQIAMCDELAKQIRTEPDPLVRRAIQETIAELHAPLAAEVLVAGLNDEDRDVRNVCCRLLGRRQDAEAIKPLSRVVVADSEVEVRMSAIAALGKFKSPAAIQALAPAIKDRDPALQYAGVQAMKTASGEDLGNDVDAWRQYAESAAPADGAGGREISVATQPESQPTVR
jgi:HEAT repeat protein